MRIRQVMNLTFPICSPKDTIKNATQLMSDTGEPYLLVVDEYNSYIGILSSLSLLDYSGVPQQEVAPLIKFVTPLREDDLLTTLRNLTFEVVPVTNSENNLVGTVTLKSILEYLPELIGTREKYKGDARKENYNGSKYTIDDIVGQSKNILHLKEQIIAAAKTKSTVLILGETGTGKELVAHAIHKLSSRRHQPFIRINCAAIPDNLLESELFGYEQGAFTGAIKGGYSGKFQLADGGTIFLDEIGDMSLSLQAKILRVLQEREIEKIGGRFPIPIDVRIIAATHCNLPEMVRSQRFRQDLFYRLHVFPIHTPPLRTIPEDIPLLVESFFTKQVDEQTIDKPKIEESALNALMRYSWPGNFRELLNVIEYSISLSPGIISREHLPTDILYAHEGSETDGEDRSVLRNHTDDAERDAILKAIENHRGNKLKVSEALGISRSSLYNKLKKYNLEG